VSEKKSAAAAKAAAKRDELTLAAEDKYGEREAQKTFAALDTVRSTVAAALIIRRWLSLTLSGVCPPLVVCTQKGRGVVVFEQYKRWWVAGGSVVSPPVSPSAASGESETELTGGSDATSSSGGLPEGVPPTNRPTEEQVAKAQALWLKTDPGDGGLDIEAFT
jgi:hypothetical protein